MAINLVFGEVRHMQGKIAGQMRSLGFSLQEEAHLSAFTLDVVKSSEIEGERFDYSRVRSSIARRLGLGRQEVWSPPTETWKAWWK